MTDKPTDEEIAALEGIGRPYGKANLAEEVRASLQAKGMVKSKGPGILRISDKGAKALGKK